MIKLRILPLTVILCCTIADNAKAGCGSASCPINSHRFQTSGSFTIGISHDHINQDQIYVGSSKSFIGAIREHHDEVRTLNDRTLLDLDFGISDRAGIHVSLPFIQREHSHIHHHHGEDLLESWDFSGFGDLLISGQWGIVLPEEEFGPQVSLVAGLKLPTGTTGIQNVDGDVAEVTIQPGSGSTDFLVGASYRQTVASVPMIGGAYGALPLIAAATYTLNGEGTDDYQFGNTLLAHIGTEYQILPSIQILFQANARIQDFADVGSTGEPRENTGGTWIFASPGIAVSLSNSLTGFSFLQLPVYQNVHGIQQTARHNLQFGLRYSMNVFGL